jgi:hypothetical protein
MPCCSRWMMAQPAEKKPDNAALTACVRRATLNRRNNQRLRQRRSKRHFARLAAYRDGQLLARASILECTFDGQVLIDYGTGTASDATLGDTHLSSKDTRDVTHGATVVATAVVTVGEDDGTFTFAAAAPTALADRVTDEDNRLCGDGVVTTSPDDFWISLPDSVPHEDDNDGPVEESGFSRGCVVM